MWAYVTEHFTSFLLNLELTQAQRDDALTKANGIGRSLFSHFYNGGFDSNTVVIVGSYGKGTAIRPPSDIDILFLLPLSEYQSANQALGNGQSQLLQKVRNVLKQTFPNTALSANGQVVAAPFVSYNVEVVPAFRVDDGSFITCNTADGGSWRASNPAAEYQTIYNLDQRYAYKATHLIKMLKAWQRVCNVPIKSLALEIAACSFVAQWMHNSQTIFWYDWMIRDFFEYLLKFQNGNARIPGIQETIYLGDLWATRCESAYNRSLKACDYERDNYNILAEDEWKKIFGDQFPRAS